MAKPVRRVSLVAAFNPQGKLLIGRRNDGRGYTLPGGHSNPGESPDKTAVRELLEEALVVPKELVRLEQYPLKNGEVLITTYRAMVDGKPTGMVDPDQEVTHWQWIDVSKGVPKDIADNLHGPKDHNENAVLRLFGLKKSTYTLTEMLRKDEADDFVNQLKELPPSEQWKAVKSRELDSRTVAKILAEPPSSSYGHIDPGVTEQVLKNPAVTPEMLETAWRAWKSDPKSSASNYNMLAKHPALPANIQHEMAESDDSPYSHGVRAHLLQNPNLDPALAHKLAKEIDFDPTRFKYQDDYMRLVGSHPNLPPEMIDRLARGYEKHTAAGAAAKNPNLPHETARWFLEQGQPEYIERHGTGNTEIMRQIIASNPSLSSENLKLAMRDKDPSVVKRALGWSDSGRAETGRLRNPNLTSEHVSMAMARQDARERHPQRHGELPGRSIDLAAVGSSAAQPEHIDEFLKRYSQPTEDDHSMILRMLDSGSPGLRTHHLTHLIDRSNDFDEYMARTLADRIAADPIAERYMTQSPNTSYKLAKKYLSYHGDKLDEGQWRQLTASPSNELREAAFRDPAIPPSVLAEAVDTNPQDHYYIANNKRTPTEALTRIAEMDGGRDETIQRALAGNPSTAPSVLSAMANSPEGAIRSDVASNKSTSRETLEQLANDPLPGVQANVVLNDNVNDVMLRNIYMANKHKYDNERQQGQDIPSDIVQNILRHPHTPSDVLHDAVIRSLEPSRDERGSALVTNLAVKNPSISPETLKILKDHPDVRPNVKQQAAEALTVHSPDEVHHQSVNVKLGTNRLRKIRDYILSQGVKELPPKKLPAGDWSVGRNAKGNIDVDKLQEAIDKAPSTRYNVSHDTWEGAQRDTEDPDNVFRLNLTNEHVKRMKEAGVWQTFRRLHDSSMQSGHPVSPSTISWVRYRSTNPALGDNNNPNAPYGERLKNWREKLGRELERHEEPLYNAERNTAENQEYDNCPDCEGEGMVDGESCPTCDASGVNTERPIGGGPIPEDIEHWRNQYKGVVQGKYPPESGAHKPYINWAREHVPNFAAELDHPPAENVSPSDKSANTQNGNHSVWISEIQSDFGQAFSKKLAAEARQKANEEADEQGMSPEEREKHVQSWMQRAKDVGDKELPDNHYQKISDIVFGGRKPNEVTAEAFLQHLRDSGMQNAKVGIHSVQSKAPISLGRPNDPVPAHMSHTYGTVPPKTLGMEPGSYGADMPELQTNKEMQGQPTWQGTVRKSDG